MCCLCSRNKWWNIYFESGFVHHHLSHTKTERTEMVSWNGLLCVYKNSLKLGWLLSGCSWHQWSVVSALNTDCRCHEHPESNIEETLCVKLQAKKWPQTQFFVRILEREMSNSNNRSSEKHQPVRMLQQICYTKNLNCGSCICSKLKLSNGMKALFKSQLSIDDERHLQLHSNEGNNICLNANIRLKL